MILNILLICYLVASATVFVVINAGLFESAINAIKYYMKLDDSIDIKPEPKLEVKKRVRFKNKIRSHRIYIRTDPICKFE